MEKSLRAYLIVNLFLVITLLIALTIQSRALTITTISISEVESKQLVSIMISPTEQSKINTFTIKHNRAYRSVNDEMYVLFSALVICKTTSYEVTKYTPYDVLKGKANCQGYSGMFYLMMERRGIPCRIVHNTTHMWNSVKIGNEWVQIDVQALDLYMNDGLVNKFLSR
jgi:transglutaminase/protease-like cytokinesis protein 3